MDKNANCYGDMKLLDFPNEKCPYCNEFMGEHTKREYGYSVIEPICNTPKCDNNPDSWKGSY